jgi:hypothetical protein
MKKSRWAVTLMSMLILTGCADEWSARSASGARFQDVEPVCRARAHLSAERQLFPNYGYNDFGDNETPKEIEDRETALCLEQHGFKLSREPE